MAHCVREFPVPAKILRGRIPDQKQLSILVGRSFRIYNTSIKAKVGQRILSRKDLRKAPAQTPLEFADSLPEPAAPVVREFANLYLGTRFGRIPELMPQMASLLSIIQHLSRPRPN